MWLASTKVLTEFDSELVAGDPSIGEYYDAENDDAVV